MNEINMILRLTLFFLMTTGAIGCSKNGPSEPPDSEVLILISIDGFRYDYQDLTETPGFDEVASTGVRAESLVPVFPTKTFPNHYTQVTGLYPENHGIVQNTMFDSVFNEMFFIGAGSPAAQDGKWYGGEPIWVTVEKQNKTAATFFWPGSDAEIGGVRPTYYEVFDDSVPHTKRVKQVLDWLDMPNGTRPDFISLYFENVDAAGHRGAASEETLEEVREVDQQLRTLIGGIGALGLTDYVNIIIVSDHGMAPLSRDRVIFLDDYIDEDDVEIINWGPVSNIVPLPGKEQEVLDALSGAHPNYRIYRRGEVPAELHYNNNRRISALVGIADDGWSVTSRSYFDSRPNAFTGGNHGYEPSNQSMHGILLATGPSIVQGKTVAPIESIHLYSLMCNILHLTPAPNDGDPSFIQNVLR